MPPTTASVAEAALDDTNAASVIRLPKPRTVRRAVYPRADPLPRELWTDTGAAARMATVYGDRIRYVHAWKRWLIWDGKRWVVDPDGQAVRYAKMLARQLHHWAAEIDDKTLRKAASKFAYHAESASGIRALLALTESEQGIALDVAKLDADPWLVNCQNGVYDLRTNVLTAHDPTLHLMKIAGGSYDPDAEFSEFERFLLSVQPNPEMQAFLWRLFGYSLLGKVTEHVLPIFYGGGSNGKSTLVNAIKRAAGEYAITAEQELLLARDSAHPTGVADLFGARLAFASETDAGRRLAEATVKNLTGGETLKARRMREDFWEFEPSHTVFLSTNHKPIGTGKDAGIWRRLRLVPFNVQITPEVIKRFRDEHDGADLDAVLAGERDGILTWTINGFADYCTNGLPSPDAVREATDSYRAESDAVARFIDQCCVIGQHFHARASDLWAAWCKWCASEGEVSGSQTAFGRELAERGYDKVKQGTVRWHGIGIASTEDE